MIDASHSPLLCDIARNALGTPDKIALVDGASRVSYGQLVQHVKAAAQYLQSLGLHPGDRILLSAQKEAQFVYLYLAAHLVGVVNVVTDSASPRERLDYIISVTRPAVLFGNGLDIPGHRCVPLDSVPDEAVGGEITMPSITSDDVADVMFTTGTTGAPKGVLLSHANIIGSARNTNGFIGTCRDDIEALALPLSHSFGLGRLRCVLIAGATLVLVNNFANLKTFFNVIDSEGVTGFGMVPAVWQYIKRLSGKRIARFASQLRYIEIGSAALPLEDKELLIEMFPTTRLCMHYGLTEASRAIFTEFHEHRAHLDAIGRPASSLVEVSVCDENGTPLPDGMDGEICVRGNMVTRSYFLPEDNQGAFFGEWFRTGDWGHRGTDGDFYLTGRKKELINIGGEKVSPVTIEEAIKALGIPDCACVAVPDPNGVLGEVPKAYLVRGNSNLEIDDIKRQLVQVLSPNEVPAVWEWIDSIPRTASGKIQRLKLNKDICHN